MVPLSLLLLSVGPSWEKQTVATAADFRGVCAVSGQVAWASGTRGTFVRTVDGGKTWHVGVVPGAEKLDFRDVEAFSDTTAAVLSIGPGENSRIYKTVDGGKTWKLQFKNDDSDAFYDAIAFWDEHHGIALSDPVKGRFRILLTSDGGTTWTVAPEAGMPAALEGEGAFAASGTCLITDGTHSARFVTGGAKSARLFSSSDRGRTWNVVETPLLAGQASAGAFSVAFKEKQGLIVGGDYRQPTSFGATAAFSSDGVIWNVLMNQLPFRSGVCWAGDRWMAVGTSGSHYSMEGRTWQEIDSENYNAVNFSKDGSGWAVGPKGRISRYLR